MAVLGLDPRINPAISTRTELAKARAAKPAMAGLDPAISIGCLLTGIASEAFDASSVAVSANLSGLRMDPSL